MRNVFNKNQTRFLLTTLLSLLFFMVPAVSHASYIGDKIGELMFYLANSIGGSVLFLGALLLDTAIYRLVIEMGSMFNNNHRLGQAVRAGWELIRDLINMTFIFGLIYIGIKTILNSEDSGTRKQLGLLIAAALLINFSLFLTQLMVDFSNLLATQIYSQLVSGSQVPSSNGSTPPHTKAQSPISSKFLTTVKMSSLLNKDALSGDTSVIKGGNLMFFSLLLMIFYCLAGFAFLMGAITIVTRFIALLIFMIFSPVVFLGWILPKFASYSTMWWENFWKYLFYAPIYIFMLYLSLSVLAGLMASSTALGSAASAQRLNSLVGQGATVGLGEIVMIFLVMVGLLWASLKIGEKLGIAGAKMAMGGFNKLTFGAGALLGAAGGAAAGVVGRETVGRLGNAVAESPWTQKNAKRRGISGVIGRTFLSGADATRNASFDPRNVGGVGKKYGLGEAGKGGYVGAQQRVVDKEKKRAKLLNTEDERFYADAGVGHIHEANQNYNKSRSQLLDTLAKTKDPAKRQEFTADIASLDNLNRARNASSDGKKYKGVKDSMKREILNKYAGVLEKRGFLGSTSAGMKEAAKELRSNAGKSKQEVALDTLKSELEKKDKAEPDAKEADKSE